MKIDYEIIEPKKENFKKVLRRQFSILINV